MYHNPPSKMQLLQFNSLFHCFLVSPTMRCAEVELVVTAADSEGVAKGLGVLCRYGEQDVVYGRSLGLVQESHQLTQP